MDPGPLAMILPMIPFREDRNLGLAYNEAMELLPADGWAIFQDHDAMPTTPHWFRQFREAIEFRPEAGAFCACTNRIASAWQKVGPRELQDSNDLARHREYGRARLKVRTLLDITETKGFGGVLFAVSKAAWTAAGGFAHGLGCVDHSLFFALKRIGLRCYMIEGLYVYHWRHFGEPDPTGSAPKAPDCPCRGPEQQPTVRIALP